MIKNYQNAISTENKKIEESNNNEENERNYQQQQNQSQQQQIQKNNNNKKREKSGSRFLIKGISEENKDNSMIEMQQDSKDLILIGESLHQQENKERFQSNDNKKKVFQLKFKFYKYI